MVNIAVAIAFVLVIPVAITYGKVFSKCELAKKMYSLGVPKSELSDWVCIAQYESGYDTKATNPKNKDGSTDWGIFQINDRYWCKPNDGRQSSNGCRIACSELLTDNIDKAVKCARMIHNEGGFKRWVAWVNNCQNSKPSINECF